MKRRSIAVGGAAVVLAAGIGGGVAFAADSNGPTPHRTRGRVDHHRHDGGGDADRRTTTRRPGSPVGRCTAS